MHRDVKHVAIIVLKFLVKKKIILGHPWNYAPLKKTAYYLILFLVNMSDLVHNFVMEKHKIQFYGCSVEL